MQRWCLGFGVVVLLASLAGAQETQPAESSVAESVRSGAAKEERQGWLDVCKAFGAECRDKYGLSQALTVNANSQLLLNGERREGKGKSEVSYTLFLIQSLWAGAEFTVSAEGGTGKGLDPLIGSFNGVNDDAGETECIYVGRMYLTQKLLEDKVELSGGKLSLSDWFDSNAAANDENAQFLSSALVNNPTIPFPDYGMGAVANVTPADWFYVMGGVADAQAVGTETGPNTAFHDEDYALGMGEFGLTPKWGELQGNYRVIVWYDPQPIQRFRSGSLKRDDLGAAVSCDQQVAEWCMVFFRYGWADGDVREIANFWSGGAEFTKLIAGRDDDALGVGVAQSVLSDAYRSVEGGSATETLFETYYRIQITKYFAITPDLQLILNPGADRDSDPAVVAGIRGVLSF